jgi:hypothetical protein
MAGPRKPRTTAPLRLSPVRRTKGDSHGACRQTLVTRTGSDGNHSFITISIRPVGSRHTRPGDTRTRTETAQGAGASEPEICCWSPERDTDAKGVYDRSTRFAESALTHTSPSPTCLTRYGKLITWTGIKGLASSEGTQPPCTREEIDALCSGIPTCWYKILGRITDGSNTHHPPSIMNNRTHTDHTTPQRVMGVAHYEWHAHYHPDRRVGR